MKLIQWITHYLFVASLTMALLVPVQLLKGHSLDGALIYAVSWSVITALIYLAVKVIKFKRAGLSVLKDPNKD